MELRRLCAYNQTRECFLGLEVAAADLSSADLKSLLGKLALKSGEGLWMEPFRGIPETSMMVPLDLIYLDEDCRVIEVVESYPTFRVTPSSPQAASVLALPTHSIYSSQTQSGDQLVLCVAEEMQRRLERFTNPSVVTSGVQSAVLLRGKPLWSGGPGVVELESRTTEEPPESVELYEMRLIEPGMKDVKPPKNWLERWWSPDPRKAPDLRSSPRLPFPNVAAYYWTGAAPKAHTIRNISVSGLYVVTEERWYPGTLILMTIQNAEDGTETSEHSLSVHSRAVRWGNDGVGLQFIPQDTPAAQSGLNPLVNGASQRELDLFLERLRMNRG
ncbi:MAG: PilZ domain-containing protein [Terracidiphilus sp.]